MFSGNYVKAFSKTYFRKKKKKKLGQSYWVRRQRRNYHILP